MNDLNFDFAKQKPVKCKNCKKQRGEHHAGDQLCPAGMKTRIGYIQFGPTKWEPKQ